VQLRRAAIEAAALQMFAVGLVNERNGKQIQSLLGKYMRQRFPGSQSGESEDNKRMSQARDMLAREVEKVYLIRQYKGDAGDSITQAMRSASPEFAAAAAKAMSIEAEAAARKQTRKG
jgi:hypothetical protein